MKYLYAAFLGAFGSPGTVEIRSASEARVLEQVRVETHHRIDVLMSKAERGPAAVAKYLRDLDELRISALDSLDGLHRDVNAINSDIARAWGRSIEFASTVKLGSTLTVKALGQLGGVGAAVSLVYDIAIGTIEDLSQAGEAQAVVLVAGKEAVEESAKEIAGHAAEHLVDRINGKPTGKELTHALTRMRQLEDKLARQVDRLGMRITQYQHGMRGPAVRDSIRSLDSQIVRNTAKLDSAQKAVVKSGVKAGIAKAVGWAFLAKDVIDAVAEHRATVAAAGR